MPQKQYRAKTTKRQLVKSIDMPLTVFITVDIIEIMENYISKERPEPELRNELDFNYEIIGHSVILNEIRPAWDNPKEILTRGFAKATHVKSKNVWKVFRKRADNKWHSYKPNPTVSNLEDFLALVDFDEYGCFKG